MRRSKPESQIKQTFSISVLEGAFAQIYGILGNIGSAFITRAAILLNASPLHFALLTAFSQVSQVFQPLGMVLSRKQQHLKKSCIVYSAIGRFLTLFLGATILFVSPKVGIIAFLGIILVSAVFQAVGSNMWIAWMAKSVPVRVRGRFFSKRNQLLLIVSLVAGYLFSIFIDMFDPSRPSIGLRLVKNFNWQNTFSPQNLPWALAGVFASACIIGLWGLKILKRQPEKPHPIVTTDLKKLFVNPFADRNFKFLLFFQVWWMFAVGVGSPFWGPFMLQKLGLSLTQMQLYGTISTLASIFSFRFWGKFLDKYGNRNAMIICIMIGGVNPLLWPFMSAQSHNLLWLEGAMSGFMWAGAGVVTTNFALALAPKGSEQTYSGIFGAFSGVAMMVSSLASGILVGNEIAIPGVELEPEQIIFVAGGLLRFSAIIPLMFVKEVRSRPLRLSLGMFNQYFKVRVLALRHLMFKSRENL